MAVEYEMLISKIFVLSAEKKDGLVGHYLIKLKFSKNFQQSCDSDLIICLSQKFKFLVFNS